MSLLLWVFLVSTGCEKDDPSIPNEGELITTVNYILSPVGGGSAVTLSFKDLDGDGGAAPTITGGTLVANQTYSGVLELKNEATTPIGNITEEIRAEAADHQFFFQSTILTVAYNDQDANGNPLGLSTTLTTGTTASGTMKVSLRHTLNKSAAGVATGDMTNAGGETDMEITFPIDVQ